MLAELTKPESDVEKVRRKCWGLLLRGLFPLTLCARRVRALVLFLFPCCTPRAERAARVELCPRAIPATHRRPTAAQPLVTTCRARARRRRFGARPQYLL